MSQRPSINATNHGAYARRTPPPHPPRARIESEFSRPPAALAARARARCGQSSTGIGPVARLHFKGALQKPRQNPPPGTAERAQCQ